ncbi:glycoside hydrolase superfamily [Phyllosticta paracitricarpa]|uniref:Glycoside hydrolase superfamily n=1 Tax=Phyllosticta paracitricarpa TaxID=2016321 RepID=A0ABR1NIR2_9PEZI
MEKYLNRAKSKLESKLQDLSLSHQDSSSPTTTSSNGPPPIPPKPLTSSPDRPSNLHPATAVDVLRYRYQHGTNLGTIFCLERWLYPHLFTGLPEKQTSELACAQHLVKLFGIDGARKKLEDHWANALTDKDLDWLVNVAKVNAIRLPIGHWTLGPDYCAGTPFANVGEVYVNAWAAVRDLTLRAKSRGVGVLIDLHGVPGGANGSEHSGTNCGRAEHWGRGCGHLRQKSRQSLEFIAHEIAANAAGFGDGVLGLQVCNEAEWEARGMWEWYDGVVDAVQCIDPSLPVYISDAWNLEKGVNYAQRVNSVNVRSRPAPVVVDTHHYWCFGDQNKHKAPEQIAGEARHKLDVVPQRGGDVLKKGAVAVVVGEWSCVLGEESWKRSHRSRDELVREFGTAQCQTHQEKAMGAFFWTYKMQWAPGGEWGLQSVVPRGAHPPPSYLTLPTSTVQSRLESALARRPDLRHAAVSSHANYWDNASPGTPFEHWRYEKGWDTGFDDAAAFWRNRAAQGMDGAEKIGSVDVWVRKRVIESGMGGEFVWEFEQGVRKGVADFWDAVEGGKA